MEGLVDILKSIGGPAATVAICAFYAIKWMEKREVRCATRLDELQRQHTQYHEDTTRAVTKALVENTVSNNAIAKATNELTQALTGRHRTVKGETP